VLNKRKRILHSFTKNSKAAGDEFVAAMRDNARQSLFSFATLSKLAVAGISWLLLEYIEPGSLTFFFAVGWLALTFFLTWTRCRLWAIPALLPFIVIVPVNFFNATYYIASDQLRLKYRSVEGSTYFEFPARWSLLKQIAKNRKRYSSVIAALGRHPIAPAAAKR
jgi:hypothetical protein